MIQVSCLSWPICSACSNFRDGSLVIQVLLYMLTEYLTNSYQEDAVIINT